MKIIYVYHVSKRGLKVISNVFQHMIETYTYELLREKCLKILETFY